MTQAKTTRKNKSQSVALKSAAKKMTASKIEPMNRSNQNLNKTKIINRLFNASVAM